MAFSAVAVLCARNEAVHVRRCIESLIQEGLEVLFIDHSSTDATAAIAGEYVGRGVIEVKPMPFTDVFSLSEQLEFKYFEILRLKHDWVVHVDADEWLHSTTHRPLLQELERVDQEGYNCVDFDELVFAPIKDEDFCVPDYHKLMRRYYFYQRKESRLLRAWKRSDRLENASTGGHSLAGAPVNASPHNFILRHYVCLSQPHLLEKYQQRIFAADEIKTGWHSDREKIKQGFNWPESETGFHQLATWDSRDFDLSEPMTKHFWEA